MTGLRIGLFLLGITARAQQSTTVTLGTSANPAALGQPLTIAATVSLSGNQHSAQRREYVEGLLNPFAFGGLNGDVYVTGDWYNTGIWTAGVYRAEFWVLDAVLPGAPQSYHVAGLAFGFGGSPGDIPVAAKW